MCGNTHMQSHLFPLFNSPFHLTALLPLSGHQSTQRPRQRSLKNHSIFSPPFFFTSTSPTLHSLIHTLNQCATISPFYFRVTVSHVSVCSEILKPTTASHHSKALSQPPSLSKAASKNPLFRTPANGTTFRFLNTKRGRFTPLAKRTFLCPSKRKDIPFDNIYLLQFGCYPVAVVILHVNRT